MFALLDPDPNTGTFTERGQVGHFPAGPGGVRRHHRQQEQPGLQPLPGISLHRHCPVNGVALILISSSHFFFAVGETLTPTSYMFFFYACTV
jgi:hypothetical protein